MTDSIGTGGGKPPPVPAVELAGITKRFGAVVACEGVDMVFHRGQIHGILGENGAGKSTLMKILIGLVLPDEGRIVVDGAERRIHDPLVAADLGIGMVHQHFSLIEALSVWENVALGEKGTLDPGAVRERIEEIGEQYGLAIDPDARVGDLPAGLRQRVEIIKCLRRDPQIVIFDEPTSVLTPEESEQLFSSLRNVVAAEGRAVALVSHKLDEMLSAADEISIMRQGRVVDRQVPSETNARKLARSMVGRDVLLRSERAALGLVGDDEQGHQDMGSPGSWGPDSQHPTLRIEEAVARGPGGTKILDGLTIELHRGTIVGLAGVEGNGQRPLGDLLSSLLPLESGRVEVDGNAVPAGRPGAMARAGIGVIPEDRHDSGVVLEMTVAENLVITNPYYVTRRSLIDSKRLAAFAREIIEEFDIQCDGPAAPMWSLSGGNQQRVVLARELMQNPKVLVAAQPTRGLDVVAIEYMSNRLRTAAEEGVAILLISSELEEILDLSNRIVVLRGGRVAGEMSRSEASLENLGLLMGGSTG